VAALGLASTVYAQAPTPQSSTQTHPGSPTATDVIAPVVASSKADKHPAAVVGTKVQQSTGENIGEVKEVLLDRQGNASYAVVSYGAVMGIGAKRTAVPWASVKSGMRDGKLIMTRSRLEEAPVLPSGKVPDTSSGTWSHDADLYWRTKVSTRSTAPVTGDVSAKPAPTPVKERT
jgi:sporulation protein YlmC with PRC-barrel domain